MTPRPAHIGIVGVSVEGALLCAKTIQARAEERWPVDQRPQVTMHMHPFDLYRLAMAGNDLETVASLLVDSVGRLASAGADFAIIPANAAHIVIDEVQRRAVLPIVNLVEEVAEECRRRGCRSVGVMGVLWTMRSGLYDAPLRRRGVEPLVPDEEDQRAIHQIINNELFGGRVVEASTSRLVAIVEKLKRSGCEAVALACTELPLALRAGNCPIAVIDTTDFLAELALSRCGPGTARPGIP